MSDLRTAAQQALEALLTPSGAQACSTCQNGPENEYCCRMEMWSAITALRAALAQQVEPLNLRDRAVQRRLATQWGYVPAAQAEPVEPVATLIAQRDALLEALKLARSVIGHPDDAHTQMIDATIKAVEGGA